MKFSEEAHDDYLVHYGIKRRSGRYPWGSGQNPHQRSKTFLDIIEEHRREGLSDSQIAKLYDDAKNGHPFTLSDLRATKSRAVTEVKREQIRTAQRLRDKGVGYSEIGRQMGLRESTVRSLLEPGRLDRLDTLQNTAEMLKRQVAEKEFLDVGANVELDLPIGDNPETRIGVSKDKFSTALSVLKEEGYHIVPVHIMQAGTGEMTRYKILVKAKPGETFKQAKARAFANRDKIRTISEKTDDRGHTYTDFGIQPPLSISSKRVAINYKEDGGADADGVIYVRPGKDDISLGKSRYAQVRIAVDGTHYLKGMAVYKDDLPVGVDLLFNTNKSKADAPTKHDAMKPLKKRTDGTIDQDNPFGAVIKEGGQILNSKGKVKSAMNLVNEEGDWDTWSRNLSRQVLSKQKPELAESQLALTYERRQKEFAEIKALTNPTVRKTLLKTFAEETDSAAIHMKAANMPNQATKVLLPSTKVKPHEIFAPTFRDGERVALVRFPHAGTFEIPEVTVNNKNPAARKLFGGKRDVPDAVVVHPRVAEHLSGADFDGDSVVVIPNNRKQITTTAALDGLKNFDPQTYKVPHPDQDPVSGRVTVTPEKKQIEMGKVTNLIADMQVKGAPFDDVAKAVRHSMVVIDSEKHNLDYKASERDNGIHALKVKYQGINPKTGQPKGASTLITRATAETRVNRRKIPRKDEHPDSRHLVDGIDKRTGKRVWVDTGETNVKYTGSDGKKITKSFRSREAAEQWTRDNRIDGKIETRKFKSRQLAETDDARTLMSDHGGTRIEKIYAEHSNKLKTMANEARKEMVNTKSIPYSPSSAKVYSPEVASLNAKLNRALKNAPLERRAQVIAGHIVAQRKRENPDMQADEKRKIKGQALKEARLRTGASKTRLGSKESPITDREWAAIQAGAISNHKLEKILANADIDIIREKATPRVNPVMTSVMTTRARQMFANGATPSEVAEALGVKLSTVKSAMAREEG